MGKDWRNKKHLGFKGEIYANKIELSDLPKINGLNNSNQGSNGTIMSVGSATSEISINHNQISLAPGECEIYDVYVTAWLPCSEGHETRDTGDCNYYTTYGTWDLVNNWDYPPGFYDVYSSTVVNCAAPETPTPPSGGGGGGSTTPNPPGGYNPCDGEVPSVSSANVNNGLKLAVLPPTPCDEDNGGLYPLPPVSNPSQPDLNYNPTFQLIPARSTTVFNNETGTFVSYGEIEDFYASNSEIYEAILYGDPLLPNALIAKWGITKGLQIVEEFTALSTLHDNWPHQLLLAVATWNVLHNEIHFALDIIGLIPVYGEAADILNGAIYFIEGDYINAAFSSASAIPVYGWVSTGGKWLRTTSKVLTKPLSAAVGKVAYRAIKYSNNTVRFVKVAVNSFSHGAIYALKAVKPADNTLTNLSRSVIDQLSYRISPTIQSLKNKIDDIVQNGDASGLKTETLCDDIFETNGFIKQEAKFGSNNGFDGVYIKKDGAGNVQEIFINEAKQVGSAGNIKLNARNLNTGLQAQMSNGWIDDVLLQMKQQGGNIDALADIIQANKSKITKTVTGVDKSSGEIVVLKLMNY